MIDNLILGFETAVSASTLFYCVVGVSIGMFMIIVTVLLNPSEASGLPHASREEI